MPAKVGTDPIDALLKDASRKYDGLTVGSINAVADDVRPISTGNIAINYIIGVGGLPLGRSCELYGLPGSGKTTTALQIIAELQRIIKAGGDPKLGIAPDDRILYLDYEQALDKDYAEALGVDLDHPSLLFTQPDTLEQGVNFAITATKTGKIRLSVFDSAAAMNPSAKAEAEIGKSLPMIQAKLMKDFALQFNTVLAKHNSSAIFINHQMEKTVMGGRPGMPPATTTPGGMALKYFASLRIQYTPIKQNKGKIVNALTKEVEEIPTSTDVRVKVQKNRMAPPYRQATVRVRFGRGFDNFWTALQIMLANKKIMHQAGIYYFHNVEGEGLAPDWMDRAQTGTQRPYIKGENSVFQAADLHPEWREQIIEMAERVARENAASLAAIAQVVPEEDDEEEDDLGIESSAAGTRVTV